MSIKHLYNIIVDFVKSCYNKIITYCKGINSKNSEINNQTDNNIQVIKAKVKKVKVRKCEN